MRLAWCDKIAIFWAILLVLFIAALQRPGGFALSLQPENIVDGWGALLGKLVLIPWIALRVIDLVCGGPSRRGGSTVVRWVRPRAYSAPRTPPSYFASAMQSAGRRQQAPTLTAARHAGSVPAVPRAR